jgi:RNA polymerase sigma-70 factor (ECF subfamily)
MTTTPLKNDAAGFAVTRWTIVLAAGNRSGHALEELAKIYWFPVYAYIRRHGCDWPRAEDLTQEFFAGLIEKKSLALADRSKGKFRAFLLACVKHFLANERDKTQAKKRGGGARHIALDGLEAEARYAIEPVDNMTPERVFEQRWARSVLDRALMQLREKYQKRNQGRVFEALKGTLVAQTDSVEQAAMAEQLKMTPGAVAVAIHRLRRHYRETLREEIAQTVASAELIDEEIEYLLNCL